MSTATEEEGDYKKDNNSDSFVFVFSFNTFERKFFTCGETTVVASNTAGVPGVVGRGVGGCWELL